MCVCVCVCVGGVLLFMRGGNCCEEEGGEGCKRDCGEKKRDPVKGMRRPVGHERVENMISAVTGLENDLAPKSFLSCFHQI